MSDVKLEIRSGKDSGKTVEPSGDRFVIGREEGADLVLPDDEVSREHAFIKMLPDGRAEIRDMGSRNGTYVNGERISGAKVLEGGEELKLGTTVISASRPGAGAETRLAGAGAGETRLGGGRGETRMAAQPAGLALEISKGAGAGRKVEPSGDRFVIGREEGADLVLDDEEVSREHAFIKMLPDGRAEIRDMGSRNGTYVNGERISGAKVLEGGEELKLGNTVISTSRPAGRGETRFAGRRPSGAAATPSGVRRMMERSNRVMIVGVGVAVVALIVAVLAIAGVFSSSSGPPSEAEIIDAVKPSTLQVVARNKQGKLVGGGTAWVYNADKGLIVTNAHVVNDGSKFEAGYDATSLHGATVVGVAPCDDLAVLRISPFKLKTLPIASPSDVHQGDTIHVAGYPANSTSNTNFLKSDFQVSKGTISALHTRDQEGFGATIPALGVTDNDNGGILLPDTVQHTASQNPGDSGGPLVNDDEKLAGVNTTGGISGSQGESHSISVEKVRDIVPQLARGESIGWAGFGVAGLPSSFGVPAMYITSVVKDTPADQAGVPEGLLITAVNNRPVSTQQQYCDTVRGIQSGEEVLLDIADPQSGNTLPGYKLVFP